MKNSNDGTRKCFSNILTKVLCRGCLPTHTVLEQQPKTTRFIDLLRQESDDKKQVSSTRVAPGLVARLMGLETLPDLEWIPNSDSYSRSRSVNSMDYLVQFDHPPHYHRRVKTSVSFREVPPAINQLSQECFVFYLDNVPRENREEKTEFGEMGKKKTEQNREKMVVKKQSKNGKSNDDTRRVNNARNCSKVGGCREDYRKAKNPSKIAHHKNKNQPKVKEAKSEAVSKKKCSPVSAMDIKKNSIRHESALPEVPNEAVLKPRRKPAKKRANFEYPSPHITLKSNNDGFKKGAIKNKEKKAQKKNGETEEYVKLMGEIYKLTETECKDLYWVSDILLKKSDDFEEVCVEFGKQILDQLLHHLIYELSGDHML